MNNLFIKMRRYFNPTFAEWLEDFNKDYYKEMNNPRVQEKLRMRGYLIGAKNE